MTFIVSVSVCDCVHIRVCVCMQVGLAVDDIKGIQEAATLTRLALRVLIDLQVLHTYLVLTK